MVASYGGFVEEAHAQGSDSDSCMLNDSSLLTFLHFLSFFSVKFL